MLADRARSSGRATWAALARLWAQCRDGGCDTIGMESPAPDPSHRRWLLDELAAAGRENLDPDHVARYDDNEDANATGELAVLFEHGLDQRCEVVDLGAGTGQFTLAVAAVSCPSGRRRRLTTHARLPSDQAGEVWAVERRGRAGGVSDLRTSGRAGRHRLLPLGTAPPPDF